MKGSITQNIEGNNIVCPEEYCYLLDRNTRHTELFTEEGALLSLGLSRDFINALLFNDEKAYFENERAVLSNPLLSFFRQEKEKPGEKHYESSSFKIESSPEFLRFLKSVIFWKKQTVESAGKN